MSAEPPRASVPGSPRERVIRTHSWDCAHIEQRFECRRTDLSPQRRDATVPHPYALHTDTKLLLITAHETSLDFRDNRDCRSPRTRARRAPDPVQIRFAHRRHIEIENVSHP